MPKQRNQLDKHLALLKRQVLIEPWHDRRNLAGETAFAELEQSTQFFTGDPTRPQCAAVRESFKALDLDALFRAETPRDEGITLELLTACKNLE